MTAHNHIPVMLIETLVSLAIKPQGIYVDATYGRGGHTQAILERLDEKGRLLAIDKDPEAIRSAKQNFGHDSRFAIEQGSFANLQQFVEKRGWLAKVDGVLLDLGVSSPQLDDPRRGFSFLHDGPLDMRMDPTMDIDAATWLNSAKESTIAQVLREYGEERFAKRIAAAIVRERSQQPILTTGRLAGIAAAANPAWEQHKHPATRTFQAIRIFINRELDDLASCLAQSLEVLVQGGRLVVISFHSLEDRIVKRFIRDQARGEQFPAGLPVTQAQLRQRLRSLGRAIKPGAEEIAKNPRARSAVLRVGEKLL